MRAFLLVLAIAACSKKSEPTPKPEPAAVKSAAARVVKIEAGGNGYVPDTIGGAPGEKLTLEFTRTMEGECLEKLKLPDGTLVELPMKKPVQVSVTVPTTGELTFACGMDMVSGKIVAGG